MLQTMRITIEGIVPLIMHNNAGADPLDPRTQELKKYTSKRKKTEADEKEIARLEWHLGLYLNEKEQPCVPGENLERMLREAAKKNSLGKAFLTGISCGTSWPLQYDGPKKISKLEQDKRFVLRSAVRVQTSTVMRTRPQFPQWSVTFDLDYFDDILNAGQIVTTLPIAGRMIGLMDYRPRYGRFIVQEAIKLEESETEVA